MKEHVYNKVSGFQVSVFLKFNFIISSCSIQGLYLLFRNAYFKEDIPMAASAIYFYKLYSLLFHWFVPCVIDFTEIEFLKFKIFFWDNVGIMCRDVATGEHPLNERLDFWRSEVDWLIEYRILNIITDPGSQILLLRREKWNSVTV